MELVEILAEVIKYIVPAALVLLAVKYMNDAQMKKQRLDQQQVFKSELLKQHLPLKLAAYERAILFLERLSPENILPRVNGSGKRADEFRMQLVQEIRNEYQHNLVQQLYISQQGWAALLQAKEEVLTMINQASKDVKPEEDGIVLAKKIIESLAKIKEHPTHKATLLLKMDIQQLFKL